MSFADVEERPAKKRRFFADESPRPPTSGQETPAGSHEEDDHEDDEIETWTPPTTSQPEPQNEFDGSLLESIVGEKLGPNMIETLQKLSDNNVERGKSCCH